ncbi:MAG: 3-carboxy-cis,cis-muconate cycloisomerase [Streptosporangiaceae bacterium]|nr:3-carboxy-cis,cis-muconate cycloisomerase [Streptosporangiaceae bacterium]
MPDHNGGEGLFGGIFGRGPAGPAGDAARVDDTAWLQALLDAEAGLARAVERAGLAPAGVGAAVTEAAQAANFDVGRLGELAALTGNPVPGLARELARRVPRTATRAVHRGATSQDIMDTAAMLLARRVIDAMLSALGEAADAAANLAATHRDTIMIGRTLLQQAVPVTFGLVAAGWLSGLDEARAGLGQVRERRLAVQFGGAAGTLASLGEDGSQVVTLLAEELGLSRPAMPWHTDRLRIIDVATALARAAAVLGKIARDVTLLAQSEVGELHEAGGSGGKVSPSRGGVTGGVAPQGEVQRGGSSAMPHKNNPVAAVAVIGCARQVPGLLATLVASAEQEYQRAAGAWHAEWEPFTALLRLALSAASWAAELLSGLVVDTARMAANLAATEGIPLAEHVASLLSGMLGSPEEAHDLVAVASKRAMSAGLPLRDVLLGVPELADRLAAAGVTPEQVEAALEPAGYLGATGTFIDAALAAHEGAAQAGGESKETGNGR